MIISLFGFCFPTSTLQAFLLHFLPDFFHFRDLLKLVGSYWCEVKQGTPYLEDQRQNMGSSGGLFAVKSFWMAKYPITNADYQQFIDANDGFRNKTWWDFSPFARLYHLENQSPTKSLSKEAISPKTNISWYDAIAFCRWLSCHIGTQVTLPTEQQWQLAAMGDTTREYPWSDKYHINDHIYEAYFTKPIPVTHHPELVSPFGVYGINHDITLCLFHPTQPKSYRWRASVRRRHPKTDPHRFRRIRP